jgi:hypothetical protein
MVLTKPVIVTTSWDDGHPSDLRLAELLASYGIAGTFYVPLRYKLFPRLSKQQIRALGSMGMEIGSHTATHPVLTEIPHNELVREVCDSKRMLEDILGDEITSFSYPCGRFNKRIGSVIAAAGYALARTTVAFRTDLTFGPLCMPVSFQFAPHGRLVGLRHSLKEGNLKGIINWYRISRMENDLVKLSRLMFDHVLENGGAIHIWGHSWELDRFGLWDSLKQVLRRLAHRDNVHYLTNGQLLVEPRGCVATFEN